MIMHQTLLGNFPQRIRWQAYYLLRQSVGFSTSSPDALLSD